jgi:hypothetical protein
MAEQQDREQMPKSDDDIRGFDTDEDLEDMDELEDEEQESEEEEETD